MARHGNPPGNGWCRDYGPVVVPRGVTFSRRVSGLDTVGEHVKALIDRLTEEQVRLCGLS